MLHRQIETYRKLKNSKPKPKDYYTSKEVLKKMKGGENAR